jgi:hypothetical protein
VGRTIDGLGSALSTAREALNLAEDAAGRVWPALANLKTQIDRLEPDARIKADQSASPRKAF